MKPMKVEAKPAVQSDKSNRVVFRPKPAVLITPLCQLGQFALLPELQIHNHLDHGGRNLDMLRHGLAFFVCAAVAMQFHALFLQCGSVDARGIYWRTRKGRQHARWDEITDFSHTISGTSVVQTERDKITFGAVAHLEQVRDFIAAHCGERLGLPSWELNGLRLRDFPQTFGYPEKTRARKARGGRVALWIALALLVVGATLTALFGLPVVSQITIGVALLAISGAIGLGGLSLVRTAAATRPRAGQKFIAQADGFTYDTGREAVTVAWGDVIGYDFHPQATSKLARLFLPLDVLRLRTEQGQEFHFLGAIDRVDLWKETIRRLATNGIETKIDAERTQALGGVQHCWSGGVEGVGDRVFHARTRSNLSLPIFFGVVTLVPVALTVCGLAGWLDLPHDVLIPAVLITVSVETFFVADYRTRRVTVGADGIFYATVGRQKRILWREIADWKTDFRGIRIDDTNGTRIRFKPSELAYGSRIAPLIEEHLRAASAKQRDASTPEASAADR